MAENLVLLQVPDEETLNELAIRLTEKGIRHVRWFEPDFDGFTAIASDPSPLFSNLPLLLKEAVTV